VYGISLELSPVSSKLPIGEAQVTIPKAWIDLRKLQEGLERGIDPIPIEVSALPGKKAKIAYRNWLSNKP
jgi:hypothetical protein